MQIFIVPGVIICFIIWVLYRLLIKKDIKKHLNEVYGGLAFIGVWVILYFWLTHI